MVGWSGISNSGRGMLLDRDALIVRNVEWVKKRVRFNRRTWLPDDAEGIALEALVEAARTWNPGGVSFRCYVRHMINFRLEDARRAQGISARDGADSRRTRTSRLTTGLQRTLGRPAAQEEVCDARRALERMAGLPERLQRVLVMRAEGRVLKEIGEELGVTESRACQLLQEALGLL